jgi:hypothetical protein
MAVCLKTMTQSWLHDVFAALNLLNEAMHVGHQIFVHVGNVRSDDCTKQNATQARRWVDR